MPGRGNSPVGKCTIAKLHVKSLERTKVLFKISSQVKFITSKTKSSSSLLKVDENENYERLSN